LLLVLSRDFPGGRAYFILPWIGRTYPGPPPEVEGLVKTNVIERVNKEFKRRTKPMELLAGERSCYLLLAFVCLKMEMNWRSKPIGKVPQNLPFLKRLAEDTFTQ